MLPRVGTPASRGLISTAAAGMSFSPLATLVSIVQRCRTHFAFSPAGGEIRRVCPNAGIGRRSSPPG